MRHQCIHACKNRADCGCEHDIQRFVRTFLGKDLHISGSHRPYRKDIQNSRRIQVGMLVGFLRMWEDKSIQLDRLLLYIDC